MPTRSGVVVVITVTRVSLKCCSTIRWQRRNTRFTTAVVLVVCTRPGRRPEPITGQASTRHHSALPALGRRWRD